MKKLTIILTACAITLFLFSCQKDKEGLVDTGTAVVKNEEQKAITNNADWNAFISRVEKNKVTKADSAYITTRMQIMPGDAITLHLIYRVVVDIYISTPLHIWV